MTAHRVPCEPRDVFTVEARGGATLATIEWYPRWRKYVLSPESSAVFSADCLRELAAFIDEDGEP